MLNYVNKKAPTTIGAKKIIQLIISKEGIMSKTKDYLLGLLSCVVITSILLIIVNNIY